MIQVSKQILLLIVAGVVFLVMLVLAANVSRAATPEQMATVYITGLTNSNMSHRQSGVIVAAENGDGWVFTCSHLFTVMGGEAPIQRVTVDLPSDDVGPYRAEVVAKWNVDQLDLAILKFHANIDVPFVPLADEWVPPGTQLLQYGYPNAQLQQNRRQGPLIRDINRDTSYAGFGSIPGDSGSPVFHDGKVVGIVRANSRSDYRGNAVITPISAIKPALTQCEGGACPPRGWYPQQRIGNQWRPAPRQQRPPQVVIGDNPAPPYKTQPDKGDAADPLVPVPPATKPGCNCDNAEVIKQLAAIRDDIAKSRAACEASKDAGSVAQPGRVAPPVAPAPGLQGPPGKDGRDGKDCEPCDTDAIAAKVLAKIDYAKIVSLVKVNVTPPPPSSTNKARHLVLVANQQASYWPRLSGDLKRAQEAYAGIRVADPPSFAVPLPQIVAYENGVPVKIVEGLRDVSDALSRVARGDVVFFQGD